MQIDALQALREIITCYSVNMTILESGMEELSDFDLGLRRSLGQTIDTEQLLVWCEEMLKPGTLIFVQDFTNSEYCYFAVPLSGSETRQYIAIGPYMESMPILDDVEAILEREKIAEEFAPHLTEYLNAVPVMPLCDGWRELCKRFCVLIHQKPINVEYMMQHFRDMSTEGQTVHEFLSADLIEQRYRMEALFCKMVLEGKTEEALSALGGMTRFRIQARYREPISQLRSGLIMMNTMLRREMIKADIHPYYIDQLSSQIGRKIDLVYTDKDVSALRTEMVRKYCMLVNNYSMKGYSEVISKVVNYIRLNLTADLSLKNFAEMYSINASYLSALFKKEMGITITEYVNRQRIQQSIALLNSTDKQVQDIAAECGIYDVNYYRRLFRKVVGMSPSEYIRRIRRGE